MARILLIDDDPSSRELLSIVLTRAGHHVVQAADGRQGLDLVHAAEFDLVLTDIVMPNLDGIEIITAVRYQCPGLPIIAMSGAIVGSDLYLRIARQLGVSRSLSKPFHADTLLRAVEQVLCLPV